MSVVARTAALFRPRSAAVKVGPIGVDIALEEVHLVQLQSAANCNPVVRAKASLNISGSRDALFEKPHQFRSLIKRALASDRFQGNKAVLALPS
ncbi:MAG: hypothetical protein GY949_05575, partial [Gammaproteobacteria bacterium]|nr:hypothetical protein [Gammaproteobacteria bacterium]